MSFLTVVLLSATLLFPGLPGSRAAEASFERSTELFQCTEESILPAENRCNQMLDEEDPPLDTEDGEPMDPDIRYLFVLQEFRHSINDAWTPFMEFVSTFATRYLILGVLFIYWAVNKRNGLYTIASMCLTLGVNQLVKLNACVYRPWIRDARIIPAGNAIKTATGYSFPSGHTATGAPLLGGMAVTSNRKHRWFPVLCVLGILLIAFSRNYLGVHTPQDVFVAICEGVLCLIVMQKIFAYLEQHPEQEDRFLLAGILFGFASIAYITWKPYPLTYVDGRLLVDPQEMMNDGYGDLAFLIAFCIGRYIERKWIRFQETGINTKGIILCAVGMVIFVLLNNNIGKPLDQMLGKHWGHFARRMITILYYMALYPWIIKLVLKQSAPSEKTAQSD